MWHVVMELYGTNYVGTIVYNGNLSELKKLNLIELKIDYKWKKIRNYLNFI